MPATPPPLRYFLRLGGAVYRDYAAAVAAYGLHGAEAARPAFTRWRESMKYTLKWADLIQAAKLRWKAQRQRIVIAPAADPDASDKSLHADMAKVFADTVAATAWAPPHVERADPFLQERLRQIGEAEHEFLRDKAKALAATGRPLYRVELTRGMALTAIEQASEQIELEDPEIGGHFPWAEYHTRKDARVRETHEPMDGFSAPRSNPIWRIIRPACGWNCRCLCTFLTLAQAIDAGYCNAHGVPKKQEFWPNDLARRNFQQGLFPDKGWEGPKLWAG